MQQSSIWESLVKRMKIAEMIEKQSEIIRTQQQIIDSLSLALLQPDALGDADLKRIKDAALMQEDLSRKL